MLINDVNGKSENDSNKFELSDSLKKCINRRILRRFKSVEIAKSN